MQLAVFEAVNAVTGGYEPYVGIASAPVGASVDAAAIEAAYRTLLGLGADPNLRDERYKATPLGWARYFDQPLLVELREPLTADDGPT